MEFRVITLVLSLCAAISPVNADIPPPPVAPKAIGAFADDKPDCLEWTDACTICKKQPDGSVACSTVGAACVQTEAVCSKRKAAP